MTEQINKRQYLWAVREYNADGSPNGYTSQSPMSKEEAQKQAKLQRKWAKEDKSGKKYRITKVYLHHA